MKYDTILFDMDGTLLDTLDDLRSSVNDMLRKYGFPERTTAEIRAFVGNGARRLLQRSLPSDFPEERLDAFTEEYRAWYQSHNCIETRPYPGVTELLARLRAAGVTAAVVSNKPDATTKTLAAKFFPGLPAFGEGNGIPPKPAPEMVRRALEQLGKPPEGAVYIGDSEVDVATARNSGLALIAVSWGFRDKELLQSLGAESIADSAGTLWEMLQ